MFDGFDAGESLQLYTMRVDAPSTTTAQLTWTEGGNGKPVWSPDGERIAFISRRDGQGDIYVMAADGSGQVNLTNDASLDALAAWSADGTRIAFMSERFGDREICVMSAEGSDVIRLTNDPEPTATRHGLTATPRSCSRRTETAISTCTSWPRTAPTSGT